MANAAKNGHEGCLRALIACDRFQQIVPEAFQALLWEAAEKGHEGCLKTLISCDHFKDVPVGVLHTIFIVAARNGREGCLKALIDCVRFAQITAGYFTTVLWNAVMNGHEGCVRILIDCARARDILQHFSPHDLLLLFNSCARTGLLDAVKLLIDPVKQRLAHMRLGDLQAILGEAAKNNHVDVVKSLIQDQEFSKINRGATLMNAFKIAAENNCVEVVKALIECENFKKETENERYSHHVHALRMAITKGHVNVVKILLSDAREYDALRFLSDTVHKDGSLEVLQNLIEWIKSVIEDPKKKLDQKQLGVILKNASEEIREDMVRALLESGFIKNVSRRDYEDSFIDVMKIAQECDVSIVQ